jgi:membrane fusion protein, multidrug efflux system
MKKKIGILLLPIFLFLLGSCMKSGRGTHPEPAPVLVTTFKIHPEITTFYTNYPGTVTALKEVGLRGEVTGYITGIFFPEGSRVRQGQKLYEIDRRQYESAFREANDNLTIAKDNLARIEKDVDRYRVLESQEAISRQQYDHAMTDLANAKSQVSFASQELDRARTNLEFSIITSPFDGSIGISLVKIGDLVTPGQTLLNTVSSDDPMAVDFVIDQSELPRFRQLEMMKSTPGDSTFRLELPGNLHYPLNGAIQLIDRAVDPQTGTIKVRLVFPNPDRDLRPGMSCSVRVRYEQAGLKIRIPFQAVLEQMGEYFVFLAESRKSKEVKVELGPRVGADVIVEKGLKSGDLLLVDGIQKLTDGTLVSYESGTLTSDVRP